MSYLSRYFFKYYHFRRNWDSSGDAITRLQAGLSGVQIPTGESDFLLFFFPQKIRSSSGAQSAPAGKQLGHKTNHTPSSVLIMSGTISPLPPRASMLCRGRTILLPFIQKMKAAIVWDVMLCVV